MRFINQTTVGTTVTRQTLYDAWANASISSIVKGDLAAGTLPLDKGSSVSSATNPVPGAIFFDQTEQVYKVWCDEVDGTGVSLWLAIMGDRRDDAFIAAQPIPPLASFAPDTAGGRYVRPPIPLGWEIYGFNLQEATIPSGTWFAGGVMGFMSARMTIDSSYSHGSDPAWSSLITGGRICLPCHESAVAEGQVRYVAKGTGSNFEDRVIGYYLGGYQADVQGNATHYTSYPHINMPIWKTELRCSGKYEDV